MGNLERLLRDEAQRYAATATERAKRHPVRAELDPRGRVEEEVMPKKPLLWHVLQTFPGLETRATAALATRRFGVYLPMMLGRRGSRLRQQPMFPEYLLVLISDIEAHWRRLRDVPGLKDIIRDGSNAAILPDEWVARVQQVELGYMVANGEAGEFWRTRRRKRQGRRPRAGALSHPQDRQEDENGPQIVSMSSKSHWREDLPELDGIEALDDSERRDLLMKALGLSIAATSESDEAPGVSA